MTTRTKVILRRGKEESVLRRHPWIFSGAIARMEGEADEGDIVDVYSHDGNFLASGHCQIGSIAVRILTFTDEEIDGQWWAAKLGNALNLRKTAGLISDPDSTCYRLVHGEGDFLPGLIVDIYGSVAVLQAHSVGMYRWRETITVALKDLYGDKITAVYDKSSQTVPPKAGLDAVDGYLYGKADSAREIFEGGHRFLVNWERGQKTGFFIDQRENRKLLARYSNGKKVLNTFCYTGGFSVYALGGGASHVDSLDSSAIAVELAVKNVGLNFGPDAAHKGITADAMEYIKKMGNDYDVIILDPPAFAKHHKVLGNALQGYRRLNVAAISKVKPGGIIFTFSCSQAVSVDQFRTMVFSSAAIAGRKVRILHRLSQPADHPVSVFHPEGEYLKGLVLYVE